MNQEFANESERVRTLRTSHGLSMQALARHCALSIRQIRQIEEGGHDAFYTPAIKQLAVRKVLAALQNVDVRMLSELVLLSPEASPRPRLPKRSFLLKASRSKRSGVLHGA